jgi:branched-chain amino acid transport system ATP-binding protein
MLIVKDLVSGYGNIEVLHNANLTIPAGERIGLFGPNGHGKTTLLKTISGLLKVKSGDISFNGQSISNLSPKEIVDMGIIHASQGNRLFPQMSVSECLTLGAYSPRAWKDREESLEKVFELFPKLKVRISQQVKTLSGGERQMLSIGAGIMSKPEVLMLDEPSLGLAPKLIEELTVGISRIAASGITMLLIDQNIEMLLECCGPLFMLEQGVIGLEAANAKEFSEEWLRDRYFGRSN